MKQGMIRIDLSVDYEDNISNETIKEDMLNMELPHGYEEDTFEYLGIYNDTTNEWEGKH